MMPVLKDVAEGEGDGIAGKRVRDHVIRQALPKQTGDVKLLSKVNFSEEFQVS